MDGYFLNRSRLKPNVRLAFAVFLLLLSSLFNASYAAVAQFSHGDRQLDLLPYVGIFADTNNTETIDTLIAQGNKFPFKSVAETGNNFGFTQTVYWIRFDLDQALALDTPLLLEFKNPLIDQIELYLPDQSGAYQVKQSGDTKPFDSRDIEFRNFLFEIPLHPDQSRTYYLRLETEGTMQISLSLWSYKAFIETAETSNLLLGGYYGIMLLLMAAAFTFFIQVREPLFLTYALYLATYIIFQLSLNGLSFQYLWPDSHALASKFTALSVGGVVIGGLAFSGSFLRIWRSKHLQFLSLFAFFIGIDLIGMFMSWFGDYSVGVRLSTLAGICLPPLVLYAAITSWLNGYQPARYFLLAWAVFLVGIFTAGLLYLGLVPHTFITIYAIQIGSIIEVILLGYALIVKLSLHQAEKHRATELAAEYLERLVQERTQELEAQNQKLNRLTLVDSMTSLLTHNASIDFLNRQIKIAHRYSLPLSVIMLDIDHFKQINDCYGHPAGDRVILAIANILRESFREADSCGRYGGEEFIVILPKTSIDKAELLAERVRELILQLRLSDISNHPISASFGISSFDPDNPEKDLILCADKALYQAKAQGRNQVISFKETVSL